MRVQKQWYVVMAVRFEAIESDLICGQNEKNTFFSSEKR